MDSPENSKKYREISNKLINSSLDELSDEDRVFLDEYFKKIFDKTDIVKQDTHLTLEQKVADRIAVFGGSWTFISVFLIFVLAWIVLNVWLLINPIDPFPFILLNVFLSLVAALQAPIIMMSQNRLAERDRTYKMYEFKINTKAEIEIQGLHQRIGLINKKLNKIVKKLELLTEEDDDDE